MLILSAVLDTDKFLVKKYDIHSGKIGAKLFVLNKEDLCKQYQLEKGLSNFNFNNGELFTCNEVPRVNLDLPFSKEPISITSNCTTFGEVIYRLANEGYSLNDTSLFNTNLSLTTGSLYLRYKDKDNWKTKSLTKYTDFTFNEIMDIALTNQLTGKEIQIEKDLKISELDKHSFFAVFDYNLLGYLLLYIQKGQLLDNIISALNYFFNPPKSQSSSFSKSSSNYNTVKIDYTKPLSYYSIKDTLQRTKFDKSFTLDKEHLKPYFKESELSVLETQLQYYKDNGCFDYSYREQLLPVYLWLHEMLYLMNTTDVDIDYDTPIVNTFLNYVIRRGA